MASPFFNRPELAGPYRLPPARRTTLADELTAATSSLIRIAPDQVASIADWLGALGQALNFPAHFGANFDALFDALCDRDLLPQTVLVLELSALSALAEEEVDTLIAVLQAAADEWREQGRCLWSLFDAPGLDLDPLPTPKA